MTPGPDRPDRPERLEQPGAPLRVLVVDDDFLVASIHTRFVSQVPGFEVVGTAATAATARAEIERLRPDLVLLDVHLPDGSGIDLLRALRAEGDDTAVLVVTAAREADTVRAAAAAGAAHYLVKPFEAADLAERLLLVRQARAALGDASEADQASIDAVFAPVTSRRAPLPKGLSVETAAAVRAAVESAPERELSASEAAEAIGISRVSARRYLEHFAATGELEVGLRYGGGGRPERRFRAAEERPPPSRPPQGVRGTGRHAGRWEV